LHLNFPPFFITLCVCGSVTDEVFMPNLLGGSCGDLFQIPGGIRKEWATSSDGP